MTGPARRLLLGIAAALLLPAAAQAQPAQAAAASPADAETAAARRLAELANPPQILLRLNLQGWEAGARGSFKLDPTVAKLESSYPGVTEAFIAATRPLAQRQSEKFVREALEVKARAFAKAMTAAEIAEVTTFLQSPLGRRVVQSLFDNANVTSVVDDLVARKAESPDAQITASSIRAAEQKAVRKTAQQFSGAEHVALMRFSATAASKKYAAANQEAERVILQMANNPDPEWLAQQTETGRAAILAFVEGKTGSPRKAN